MGGDENAAAPERETERRLNETLTLELLFDGPLDAEIDEIADALAEDFPNLRGWRPPFPNMPPVNIGGTTAAFLQSDDPDHGGRAMLISYPHIANSPIRSFRAILDQAARQSLTFNGASDAVAAMRGHLTINMDAKSTDIVDRFHAARVLSSIAAVFAKLPMCLGIYVPWAQMIVAPKMIVDAAEQAAKDEWPLAAWINILIARDDSTQPPLWSATTIGLASFKGVEMQFAKAPVDVSAAGAWTFGACWLLLQSGNQFSDGNTMGLENSDLHYRLRFFEEGREGVATDCWVVIHPDAPLAKTPEERAAPPPAPIVKPSVAPIERPAGAEQPSPIRVEIPPRPGFFASLLRRRDRMH
ncbi:MAG: hypothetical protein AAFR84_09195 [Pseudomonadota bacterium]